MRFQHSNIPLRFYSLSRRSNRVRIRYLHTKADQFHPIYQFTPKIKNVLRLFRFRVYVNLTNEIIRAASLSPPPHSLCKWRWNFVNRVIIRTHTYTCSFILLLYYPYRMPFEKRFERNGNIREKLSRFRIITIIPRKEKEKNLSVYRGATTECCVEHALNTLEMFGIRW